MMQVIRTECVERPLIGKDLVQVHPYYPLSNSINSITDDIVASADG